MFNIIRRDNGRVIGRRDTFASAVEWVGEDADYYAIAESVPPLSPVPVSSGYGQG